MEKLFLSVFHMSVTASLVIIAVLIARLALRKAPKVFSYALWGVVLFRLLCPVTIESRFALIPDVLSQQSAPISYVLGESGAACDPWPGTAGTWAASDPAQEGENAPAAAPLDWIRAAAWLWLAGTTALLVYGAWSLARLRRKLAGAELLEGEDDVLVVRGTPSPFVLGVLFPEIYLPSGLSEGEREYILLHERTHIRRGDHITRALAWLAAAVHWFNPLVWLAFYLAGKDMEMSCDEAVLGRLGREIRKDYSTSLLRLSTGGNLPAGPLAFGGGDLKRRIKNVLGYQKPALWVPVLAFIAVVTVGASLAAAPKGLIDPDSITGITRVTAEASLSPQGTIICTAAARREALLNPAPGYELDKERGDMLIRLINSYHRTVYGRGGIDLNGSEHHLYRLDCADGGYYLVDYWYWNGFSLLHFGEDSYTTLVTRYDSEGNAGTTWQMEYWFDAAYRDWSSRLPPPPVRDGGDGRQDLIYGVLR